MNSVRKFLVVVFIVAISLHSLAMAQGKLFLKEGVRYLELKGDPYEMGYYHGHVLADDIQTNLDRYIRPQLEKESFEQFRQFLPHLQKFIPQKYIEEMRGLAKGAKASFEEILILNLFPEMVHCIGLTVKDEWTIDQDLYHVRVLDYRVGKNLQDTAVVLLVDSPNSYRFVNLSYAGFIGCISGMNEKRISLGEIGGKGYGHHQGIPMPFLMRKILEESSSIGDVEQIMNAAARTCEFYYVAADGKTKESLGFYTTSAQCRTIHPGSSYAMVQPKEFPKDADLAVDKLFFSSPEVKQEMGQTILLSKEGKLLVQSIEQPENILAVIGFAHPGRFPVLMKRLFERKGRIDELSLMEIIKRPVALESNLHNVIFQPSKLTLWISHASEEEPACNCSYNMINLQDFWSKE